MITSAFFSSLANARRLAIAGGICLGSLALTACSQGRQLSTQAAGHTITAQIKGNGTTVEGHADGALLGSEFGKVRVERARLRIEGEQWVKIDEEVPVTVSIQRGRIKVSAGKVSVGRSVSE